MLTEKIITCDHCGRKLRIPNKNHETARQVSCPACGNNIFVSFMSSEPLESSTVYAPPTGKTDSHPHLDYKGTKYFIENVETVIGRKANSSTADIQIPSNDMYMGRHHAVIIKTTDTDGHIAFILKAKDAKNGLSVNDITLSSTDEVKLLDDAVIKMGNTIVVFRK